MVPAAAQAVLCRRDPSAGASVERVPASLPRCVWKLDSVASLLELVSCEQPSFVQGLSVNPSSTTYSPVVYLNQSHVSSYGGHNKMYLSTAQQTSCIVYLTVNFGLDNIVAITAEMSGLKEFS